jgi:hypothetical protein
MKARIVHPRFAAVGLTFVLANHSSLSCVTDTQGARHQAIARMREGEEETFA